MNFIETLKSVGGVKPCPKCAGGYIPHLNREEELCSNCHGKIYILDLAPLLASGLYLKDVVADMIEIFMEADDRAVSWNNPPGPTHKNLHVIGPQRASNLVYEVARQLGGTAVVVIEQHSHYYVQVEGAEVSPQPFMHQCKVTLGLSLPIPDNATVLFVTDRLTKQDEEWVTAVLDSPSPANPGVPLYEYVNYLPYVLCLMTEVSSFGIFCGPGHSPGKIISLHQEIK